MTAPEPIKSVLAEAPAAEAKAAAIRAKPHDLLDGGEIIQLSIKPSIWFIAIVSLRVVAPVALLAAALLIVVSGELSGASMIAIQLLILVGAGRVGVAALQWASKLYVLTNRRILRFRGVTAVEVHGCALQRVAGVELRCSGLQAVLGLGSIIITPSDSREARIVWEHVASPGVVRDQLARAIERTR